MMLNTWWTTWGKVATGLFTLFGSFASLVGLLLELVPSGAVWSLWDWVLTFLSILFLVALVVREVVGRPGRRVYAKSDVQGIRRYMHDWIKYGGRVAIWTRDMSWAQNADTRHLLTEKAGRNELVLCLPERNALAAELEAAGAEVCIYGPDLLESPGARFTITFLGRDGSRVAVGRAEGEAHVIDEFAAGEHPAYHLAADLVSVVRALRRRRAS